jgi:hypothetical protein
LKKANDYRNHALECRDLAKGALSEKERSQLLNMAETWENLARDREDFIVRHPELSRRRDP